MMNKKWILFVFVCLLNQVGMVFAQAPNFPKSEDPLIAPPSERIDFKEEKIDQEFIEITPYYGFYGIDGFSTSNVMGLNLALHLTEDVFFEGNYGISEVSDDSFGGGLTIFTDTDLTYWNVNLGYNLFPGQIFLTRNRTLNSTIYIVGGAGLTEFDAKSRFTFNFGTGYKIFFTDWMDAGFRLSLHSFESDVTGVKEQMFNLEGIVSVAFFF
ncbi:MAG: outer membrane beta-barrel domain-containing protein [Nitrospirae bacterium]|nr:outer membrane beta-barrel domain-containing protein [Candidatus Manganitrophaceae bacterium]